MAVECALKQDILTIIALSFRWDIKLMSCVLGLAVHKGNPEHYRGKAGVNPGVSVPHSKHHCLQVSLA